MSIIEIAIMLVAGHALADYPLQGDFIAKFKSHKFDSPLGCVWPWVLTAHAAIHAGVVLLVTGSVIFAAFEFVAHTLIDWAKCDGWFGFHTDQALHLLCKLLYVALLAWAGWAP